MHSLINLMLKSFAKPISNKGMGYEEQQISATWCSAGPCHLPRPEQIGMMACPDQAINILQHVLTSVAVTQSELAQSDLASSSTGKTGKQYTFVHKYSRGAVTL